MEISPIQILFMMIASLAFGMCAGVLNDVNRIVKVFFGSEHYRKKNFEKLYSIKLPILGRSIDTPQKSRITEGILPVLAFFQDITFFCFSGIGVAIINYYFNNGRARIYTPIAVITGFIIYYFTVGRVVIFFSEIPVFVIKALILIVFELFYKPTRLFVGFFGLFAKKIYKNLHKTIAKKQKKVYNKSKKNFVKNRATLGFVDITKC